MSNSFIKARFDGNIWFEDNPGGGAIFGISLPLKNIGTNKEESGADRQPMPVAQ